MDPDFKVRETIPSPHLEDPMAVVALEPVSLGLQDLWANPTSIDRDPTSH